MADRKAYQDKVEAQLKEWKAELDKLNAKALKADADARITLGKTVDELSGAYRAVQDKFVGLVAAGEQTWDDAKAALETASDEFKRSWQDARSKIEKERRPVTTT